MLGRLNKEPCDTWAIAESWRRSNGTQPREQMLSTAGVAESKGQDKITLARPAKQRWMLNFRPQLMTDELQVSRLTRCRKWPATVRQVVARASAT